MERKRQEHKAKIISLKKEKFFITVECHPETIEFSSENIGGYIKFLENSDNTTLTRTVTIADILPNNNFILDIVNHNSTGPMQKYFQDSNLKKEFSFYGPGDRSLLDLDKSQYFFIGDYSAYPAIKAQIQRLVNKKIYLFLLGDKESSQYFSQFSNNINIQMFSHQEFLESGLIEIRNKFNIEDDFIWAAGERLSINSVRKFLKENYEISLVSKYLSSYWQEGLKQEEHSALKKQDN